MYLCYQQKLHNENDPELSSCIQVDGVNILRVAAKYAKAYGRALVDLLFMKHEQKASVVSKSKTTTKPPLDLARVEQMFGKIVLSSI